MTDTPRVRPNIRQRLKTEPSKLALAIAFHFWRQRLKGWVA